MALVDSATNSYHHAVHSSQQYSCLGPLTPKAASVSISDRSQIRPRHIHPTSSPSSDSLPRKSVNSTSLTSHKKDHQLTTKDSGSECATSRSRSGPSRPVMELSLQEKRPFQKWMKTLQRKASRRQPLINHDYHFELPPHLRDESCVTSSPKGRHHRASSSGSSFQFVSAMRSASISLASTRPRRSTARSFGISRTDKSSRASAPGPRLSEDSIGTEGTLVLDAAMVGRSLQRRRILEELINTEECYIGDIKFLTNVYVTILAALPTFPGGLRSSINHNLTEMIELHEEILGELHRIVPFSEYTHPDVQEPPTNQNMGQPQGHRRWRSLDAVPEYKKSITSTHESVGMAAEPQVAAEVAKIFSKKMKRFFIYKEYGAKYERMIQDVASANQAMPEWESYQRGLEALASTLVPIKHSQDTTKKALTIGDLLVKPVQRICKYPLLFSELLKYTPVCDCPNSHMELETTLARLREATAEINKAADDSGVKDTLEKTWILQDRLVFPHRQLDAATRNQIRSFGRVQLCGVLHACWQTKEGADGQYMVCILYQDVMCLAVAGRVDPFYTVMASICLDSAKIEAVDNGRGLQCHTAPFSWKLVFESDYQLYEVVLTACSPNEEKVWRDRLGRQRKDEGELRDPGSYSSLELHIKSLGTLFGNPGTMARRLSIHRATTVGPKSPLYQVVLKNTSVVRDKVSHNSINRSQSLLTTNTRLPVLAPAPAERARLETQLGDVWSRDILPFSGMTMRSRSDHLVRASSVMRKFSVASLANSLSKRSGSFGPRNMPSNELTPAGGLNISEDEPILSETSNESSLDKDMASQNEQQAGEDTKENGHPLTPTTTSNGETEMDDIAGTVRRFPLKSLRQEVSTTAIEDEGSGTRVVQKTPVNKMQFPIPLRTVSKSLVGAKENKRSETTTQGKGLSRWAKVGITRSQSKRHGLRSLFQ